MHLFLFETIKDNMAFLTEEESHHCIKVMRKKNGDVLHATNGVGLLVSGTLWVSGKLAAIRVEEQKQLENTRPHQLTLAIAPTKNIERLEWLLEKTTEIGVDTIVPIWCERSERTQIKRERLLKIVHAACKQSLHYHFPILEEAIPFKKFVETAIEGQRFIAHCQWDSPYYLDVAQSGGNQIILIGPEGDFSASEIKLAESVGFQSISLGTNRLRTETAGIVAAQFFNFVNQYR